MLSAQISFKNISGMRSFPKMMTDNWSRYLENFSADAISLTLPAQLERVFTEPGRVAWAALCLSELPAFAKSYKTKLKYFRKNYLENKCDRIAKS